MFCVVTCSLQVVLSTTGTKGAQPFLCFFLIIEIPLHRHWMSSNNASIWVKTSFFRARKIAWRTVGNVFCQNMAGCSTVFLPSSGAFCILQIKNTSSWICIYIYNKTIFQQKTTWSTWIELYIYIYIYSSPFWNPHQPKTKPTLGAGNSTIFFLASQEMCQFPRNKYSKNSNVQTQRLKFCRCKNSYFFHPGFFENKRPYDPWDWYLFTYKHLLVFFCNMVNGSKYPWSIWFLQNVAKLSRRIFGTNGGCFRKVPRKSNEWQAAKTTTWVSQKHWKMVSK